MSIYTRKTFTTCSKSVDKLCWHCLFQVVPSSLVTNITTLNIQICCNTLVTKLITRGCKQLVNNFFRTGSINLKRTHSLSTDLLQLVFRAIITCTCIIFYSFRFADKNPGSSWENLTNIRTGN